MNFFPEVKASIEAIMIRMKFEGYWLKGRWTHHTQGDFPFAIVINENEILNSINKRFPGGKFNDIDLVFEAIDILHWGYNSEFGICSVCQRIFSLNPEDHEFLKESESNTVICFLCAKSKGIPV